MKLTIGLVGAAGFEPTITGSKPDALPLGYAPIVLSKPVFRAVLCDQNTKRNNILLRNLDEYESPVDYLAKCKI